MLRSFSWKGVLPFLLLAKISAKKETEFGNGFFCIKQQQRFHLLFLILLFFLKLSKVFFRMWVFFIHPLN